jgi:hypothetical protein
MIIYLNIFTSFFGKLIYTLLVNSMLRDITLHIKKHIIFVTLLIFSLIMQFYQNIYVYYLGSVADTLKNTLLL